MKQIYFIKLKSNIMKVLSVFASFILVAFFLQSSNAQIVCHVNDGYYYHHNHHRHYKNKYKYDRNSIIEFRKRIDQGVWSGELTRSEENYLKRKLNRLVKYENKAYRNGHITRYERRKIEKRKRNLDEAIYEKKHNSRTRY